MIIIHLLALINRIVYLYSILLIVYALMSWFPGAYQSKLGQLLGKICEPFLRLFQRLPLQFAGIDFSIMVAIFALNILMRIIDRLAYMFIY